MNWPEHPYLFRVVIIIGILLTPVALPCILAKKICIAIIDTFDDIICYVYVFIKAWSGIMILHHRSREPLWKTAIRLHEEKKHDQQT